MDETLSLFFRPRGVAIVGASASSNKLSYGILKNMTLYGYSGGVYPVNPRYEEILGLKCYPDIASIPDPVDLAVIILPSTHTQSVLEACGQRGIRAVIIISGGFKEIGPRGAELEADCCRIARSYGMRLIGPNCVGTLDTGSGLDTTFIQGIPARGRIGFISQSGAVGGGVVDYFANKGIGFSMFASLGNEADVTETDLIEYLAYDQDTAVIALYVEGIKDGRRFVEVARQVSRVKPIVVLKAGRTNAGARAVSSHTGSLAGSNTAYRAAFKQAGVIEAETVADLFNIAMALDYQPLPKGPNTVILTNAGGPAALASDALAESGMELQDLEAETKAYLRPLLNPSAQVANPVDMLGGAEPKDYEVTLARLMSDSAVDAALAILVPQALVNPEQVAASIGRAAKSSDKPVAACFMGEQSLEEAFKELHRQRIPAFTFPESAGRVLGAMRRYQQWLDSDHTPAEGAANVDRLEARYCLDQCGETGAMGEAQTRPLLEAYGIPVVPGEVACSPEDAARAAEKIGYPVALKVVSPDVLHKSDAGGIRLHLADGEAVRRAYDEIVSSVCSVHPNAQIDGVLVETMARRGTEVIIGMKRDPGFGPLIMFGMGGIYVELFGDVAFRVAPVSQADAAEMVQETKAGRVLNGLRGQGPADVDVVIDTILRMSQLALDFPEIDEVEINPLVVYPRGEGALALDARVILD